MQYISYRGHRFPPDIIQHAVWLYCRFTLSYRVVEELLAERGIDVTYGTLRQWVTKFGPAYARKIRKSRPQPHDCWHLDEMFVCIGGRQMYLWRAVDAEGEVLEILVQSKRNKRAALRLMRKLLRKYGTVPPNTIVTDKWRAYSAALKNFGIRAEHVTGKRKNNRAENSHQPVRRRERKMQRFLRLSSRGRPLVFGWVNPRLIHAPRLRPVGVHPLRGLTRPHWSHGSPEPPLILRAVRP